MNSLIKVVLLSWTVALATSQTEFPGVGPTGVISSAEIHYYDTLIVFIYGDIDIGQSASQGDFGESFYNSRNCMLHRFALRFDDLDFTFQYPGLCSAYRFFDGTTTSTVIEMAADPRDELLFEAEGYLDLLNDNSTDVSLYTTALDPSDPYDVQEIDSDEGIETVIFLSRGESLYLQNYELFVDQSLTQSTDLSNVVLLLEFNRFMDSTTVTDLSGIKLAQDNFGTTSVSLNGSISDRLLIDLPSDFSYTDILAFRLSNSEVEQLIDQSVCIERRYCHLFIPNGLVNSTRGVPSQGITGLSYYQPFRTFSVNDTEAQTEPVRVLFSISYFGYNALVSIPDGEGFSFPPYRAHKLLTGLTCALAGSDASNPQFYINNEPAPEEFVVVSGSDSTEIYTPDGFISAGLLGYFQCRAESLSNPDTPYSTSHLLHYSDPHIIFYEGSEITVESGDNITFPFAYYTSYGFLDINILTADGSFIVPFERWYVQYDNQDYVYGGLYGTGNITIQDVRFSYEGFYQVLVFYGQLQEELGFSIIVKRPEIEIDPIIVLGFDETELNLICTTDSDLYLAWFDLSLVSEEPLIESPPTGGSNTVTLSYDNIAVSIEELRVECRVQNPEITNNITYFDEGRSPLIFQIPDSDAKGLVAYASHSDGSRVRMISGGTVPDPGFRLYECIGDDDNTMLRWEVEEFNLPVRKVERLSGLPDEDEEMFLVTNIEGQYISLVILGSFEGNVSCYSVAGGNRITFDVYTSALIEGDDYIQFIYISSDFDGELTTPSRGDPDGCTFPIHLNVDLPYGTVYTSYIHVCTNGLLTVGSPLVRWSVPLRFPTDNSFLADSNIVAPFWADIDIRESGRIYYKTFTGDDSSIDLVNGFVQKSYGGISDFQANWMFVAHWDQVIPYGINDYDPNTFQVILISDEKSTYAVYSYYCGDLNWGRGQTDYWAVIGYNINILSTLLDVYDGFSFENNPFSASSAVTDIACKNVIRGTRWSNVVYKVGEIGMGNPSDYFEGLCKDHFISFDDNFKFEQLVDLTNCPCTLAQALRDASFLEFTDEVREVTIDTIFYNVRCFAETFSLVRGLSPLKQCCYDQTTGTLTNRNGASMPLLFNPRTSQSDYVDVDLRIRQFCERGGSIENPFRLTRPELTCTSYSPPVRALCAGDPHLSSLDGEMFTFNGWGEYLLLRYQDDQTRFELQTRTEPVAEMNGATQLIAFAFAMLVDYPVEVRWNNGDFDVFLNRTNQSAELANTNDTFELSHIRAKRLSPKSIIFSFPNKMFVGINITGTSLAFDMGVPDRFKGQTIGMVGNYNGNTTDDVRDRYGNVAYGQVSDTVIHQVGQTWQLIDGESFFTYPADKTFQDYAHPEHNPSLIQSVIDSASQEIKDACGNNPQCIYDSVQTGDIGVGLETMDTIDIIQTDDKLTRNFPPMISGAARINVTLGEPVIYDFQVSDEKDTFDVRIIGSPPPGTELTVGATVGSTTQYHLTFLLTEVMDVSIQIMAIDELEAAFTLDLQLYVCACQNNGNCSLIGVDNRDASSVVLNCQCSPGWDGRYCESDYDGCLGFECFAGTECTDLPPPSLTAECGPCPDGYRDDGAKCADINECDDSTINNCEQVCVNTPGSWECACNNGYQLSSDSISCQDVNECDTLNGGCHQVCDNLIGSFTCSCEEGLEFGPDGVTCVATNVCGDNQCAQICYVVGGSQLCGCNRGYQLSSDQTTCQDVDECALSPCDQECTNTIGSYQCSCSPGYQLVDGSCVDINECIQAAIRGTQVCHPSMLCENNAGGYSCSCPPGTQLAVDECVDPSHIATRAPATVPIGFEIEAVQIALNGYNLLAFDIEAQDLFRTVTAASVTNWCLVLLNDCPVTAIEDRSKRQSSVTIDHVILTSIINDPSVTNRILLQVHVLVNGFVLHGDALLAAIENGLDGGVYSAQGFDLQYVRQVDPTVPPVTPVGQTTIIIIVVVCVVAVCCCFWFFVISCIIHTKINRYKRLAGLVDGKGREKRRHKRNKKTEIGMAAMTAAQGQPGVAGQAHIYQVPVVPAPVAQQPVIYQNQQVMAQPTQNVAPPTQAVKIDPTVTVVQNPIAQ